LTSNKVELGGSGFEWGSSIAVDGSGNAYVTGGTASIDFPIKNAQQNLRLYIDAFIFKLSSNGQTVYYSTCLGGSDYDWGNGIAVDGSENIYVMGYTSFTDFQLANPKYPDFRGMSDAFIAKIADGDGGESPSITLDVLDGQDFRSGVGIITNPEVLGDLRRNKPMIGAATNGEARLVLRARTDQPGSVTFSIPAGDGELYDSLDQDLSGGATSVTVSTVPVNGEDMAFAIYRAPEQFPRAGHAEDESMAMRPLVVTFNTIGGLPRYRDLILKHPPVVLIHSWNSNDKDCWGTFEELITADTRIPNLSILKPDYSKTSNAAFSVNADVLINAVNTARNQFIKG
jgi:hypothetical protein